MSDANDASSLVQFFGRLHPLMVHLPIGFLATLAVLEVVSRIRHFKGAAQARGVVVTLTVLSAVSAVACGLLLAAEGGYDPHLLTWHKWMGIALAAGCVLTAVSFWTGRLRLYGGSLLATLLMLGPASHFGGSMTHGRDYLTEHAPTWLRTAMGHKPSPVVPVVERRTITDPGEAEVYGDLVRPILEQHCTGCHNPDKLKGELRLDSVEELKKGGKSGPSVVLGKGRESLVIQRIQLPEGDPKRMPPAGKGELSDEQIAVLEWWIDAGVPTDKTVAQLEAPLKVVDAVAGVLGIKVAEEAAGPAALNEVGPVVARLQGELGVGFTPVAVGEPWLAVNASLAGKSFGDEQLGKLAEVCRNVAELNLAGTKVTDAGMAVVGGMPNLQRLRLERTGVTDAGLARLGKLRRLEYLNLYGTGVSGAGLKALAGLPNLRQVYVWQTKVEPEAAKAFADAMVDRNKVRRWEQEIKELEARIRREQFVLVEGVRPAPPVLATAPSTSPSPTPALPVPSPPPSPSTSPSPPPLPSPPPPPLLANAVCPVSGKPVDPTKFVEHEGKRIGFCCGNCPETFKKDPAKYIAKLAAAEVASTGGGEQKGK